MDGMHTKIHTHRYTNI